MSGDVHYAQMYTTQCESHIGYNLIEVCSSGLTHVLRAGWPTISNFCEAHTPLHFKVKLIQLNYFITLILLLDILLNKINI